MDFSIDPKLSDLTSRIAAFVRDELVPLEPAFASRPFREMLPVLAEKRARVRSLGWWAPFLPTEHGGMGLSLVEYAQLSEHLGRSPLGHYVFNCQAPDVGNLELLLHAGTEAQKQTWFGPLSRGEIRSCFSMTEPENPGSNPIMLSTTAVEIDGHWVINGHKWFTSGADGSSFAIVMAVTDPDAPSPYLRASQIIVPMNTPGLTLVRNISVMGEAGTDYATHAEIRYDDCRVPRENILGERGMGFALAQQRLGPGRIHHCMRWIGICERAFELMCTRAATRHIAPGKPLGTRQIIQEWVADSRAEIDAARWMVLHAAWKMDREGQHAARDDISTIKFVVANTLQRVLDRAIQVHGALGITDDTPLAYWWRHERGARIYDGADEVHKSTLAKRILARAGMAPAKE